MRTRWSLVLGVVMTLVATAAFAAPDFASMQVIPYEPPKPAPAFTLPDLNGMEVHLSELRGKVAMLFFWATWLPDCRKELPSVNRIASELKGKGLELVMIAFREDPELVRRTVKERGYTGRVLLDESGDTTGRVYGVFGTPTVYFVDRQGNLVGRLVGARDWESQAVRKFVEQLLETK
jgi:thiol-disulfide isomerase/thioredoxin